MPTYFLFHASVIADPVALFQRSDTGPDLDHGAGSLVTQDHRLVDDEGADPPVGVVVDVGAADAGVVDGHEDVAVGLEGGDRALLEGEV